MEFNHPFITEVCREKVECGDYKVVFSDGHCPPIRWERKSLADLTSSLSKGYKRFKREIIRAKEKGLFLVIIIEAPYSKVLEGFDRSYRTGEEICQQLSTLMVRHKIPFWCFKDRKETSEFLTQWFCALGREYIESKKQKL